MFAAALKAARRRSGLSAQQAAALLAAQGLVCSRGTLLAWERGQGPTTREPFASDLAIIAGIYRCAVDELFKGAQTLESSKNFESDGHPRAEGDGRPERPSSDRHWEQ
jgi:transcriptional regulator with XRE-family HTH domain